MKYLTVDTDALVLMKLPENNKIVFILNLVLPAIILIPIEFVFLLIMEEFAKKLEKKH